MKHFYFLTLLLLICTSSFAQGFERVQAIDWTGSPTNWQEAAAGRPFVSPAGNYIVIDGSWAPSDFGVSGGPNLREHNANGDFLQNVDISFSPGTHQDIEFSGRCYDQTATGEIVLVGTEIDPVFPNQLVVKKVDNLYSSVIFENRIDLPASDERAMALHPTSDGGCIITGFVTGPSATIDWMLLKVDALGAQEWVQYYGGASADKAYCVITTSDGGYLMAGEQGGIPTIVKTDASGIQQWMKQIATWSGTIYSDIQEVSTGGYIATTYEDNISYKVVKLDALGDTTWTELIPEFQTWYCGGACSSNVNKVEADYMMIREAVDGYYVCGNSSVFTEGQYRSRLAKVDFGGGHSILKSMDNNNNVIVGLTITPDNYVLMAGKASKLTTSLGPYVVKCDTNGRTYPNRLTGVVYTDLNRNCQMDYYGEFTTQALLNAISTAGDTIEFHFIDFDGAFDFYVPDGDYRLEVHSLGNPLGSGLYFQPYSDCVIDTADFTGAIDSVFTELAFQQGPILLGQAYWDLNNNCIKDPGEEFGPSDDPFITINNSSGIHVGSGPFYQNGDFHTDNDWWMVPSITHDTYTISSAYPISGCFTSFTSITLSPGNDLVYVDLPLNARAISGRVYLDTLSNCIADVGENGFANAIISGFDGAGNYIYTVTDTLGNYNLIVLDTTASYTLNVSTIGNNHDNTCNVAPVVSPPYLPNPIEDFPLDIVYNCPEMKVTLGTNFLRRCMLSNLTVSYQNIGTNEAFNSYINITLPATLTYVSSTIPYTSQIGNVYKYDVGNINAAETGAFEIQVMVDCASELSQAHCLYAEVYPDSGCVPVNPLWDLSSVSVTGSCIVGDSAQFIIKNIGGAAMSAPSDYRIIIDGNLSQTSSFSLPAGDSIILSYDANGATYRIEADQVPNHPGMSNPCLDIEACGTNGSGSFSMGHITTTYKDDDDYNVDILCAIGIGAFDPNDKIGTPLGYGPTKIIHDDTRINYRIRFQNTGTDTAFNVVVRDTLSPFLDPLSIQEGSMSHNGTMNMFGSGIVEWHFPMIFLPDSNINEPGSHGYIYFSIDQLTGNPIGTLIENDAAIYFDFNEPVITNTDFHTVGELLTSIINVKTVNLSLKAYPNPFSDYAIIEFENERNQPVTLTLTDLNGKLICTVPSTENKIRINKNQLSAGTYLFEVRGDNMRGTGKLIAK
jgi:uncharacterized repeat protein (TIGR01451 family)